MIAISVQASPTDLATWRNLAHTLEDRGFNTLYVADHPGTLPAPFVSLAAAASVTERLRLGTCVVNVGRWEPVLLANEAATLDVLCGGRTVLGLGAGHTPAEWSMVGHEMPSPQERVDRLSEVAGAVQILLSGGRISYSGSHVTLCEAELPIQPLQKPIPLLIGGNGSRLLAFAAANADIVSVSGTGRTLPDGHRHEARWSHEALDATFGNLRSVAAVHQRAPEIEVLVQGVEFTNEPAARAEALSCRIPGTDPSDLLPSPFLWLGSPDAIARALCTFRERWGITRYVVRERAVGQATEILAQLVAIQ